MCIKYVNFHNASDVSIMVDSWVDGSNSLQSIKIEPGKIVVLHSSVGEWHLNAMFEDEADRNIWNEAGLERYTLVGKFRSQSCMSGDYSWMEFDKFECVYSKLEDGVEHKHQNINHYVKGLITFRIQ